MKFPHLSVLFLVFCLLCTCTACSMFRPVTEHLETSPSSSETLHSGYILEETSSSSLSIVPPSIETPSLETIEYPEFTNVVILPEDTETSPESRVSFVGAGDNIIYYGNVRDAASCAVDNGRKYNFQPIYSDIASYIQEADISFINQETLMCGDGYSFSYYPRFNGPQDLGYDLAELGFDIVNIANNHMLDKGEPGLTATMDFWNTIPEITLLGGYRDAEDYAMLRVIQVNDIRIAFLSYTFSTNGLILPSSSSLVIPYPDENTVISQLSEARNAADFIIVSVHWGDENSFKPNTEQETFASLLAENGADVILGHHPHVIQPIEWLNGIDNKKTLCVYSLGNFVAEMSQDYNMLGGLISFDIVKSGDSVSVQNVIFIPTVYYFTTTFYQNHVYLLSNFTEELSSSHGLAYYQNTISIPTLYRYLHNTIREEFLPSDLRVNISN